MQCSEMQWNAVKCCVVQYSTYNAVQHHAIKCCVVQYSVVQCCAVWCSVVQSIGGGACSAGGGCSAGNGSIFQGAATGTMAPSPFLLFHLWSQHLSEALLFTCPVTKKLAMTLPHWILGNEFDLKIYCKLWPFLVYICLFVRWYHGP